MKLSDLKTGMWVKFRNGDMYLFLKEYETKIYGVGAFVSNIGFMALKGYNDNMKHENHDYDIVEVFIHDSDYYILNKDDLLSIWKRAEIPQLALEVLKSFDPRYKWIAKDDGGRIYVYDKKPIKNKDYWGRQDSMTYCISLKYLFKQNLFDWINWEDKEPCYIPDLIKEHK